MKFNSIFISLFVLCFESLIFSESPIWELNQDSFNKAVIQGQMAYKEGGIMIDGTNSMSLPKGILGDQKDFTIEFEVTRPENTTRGHKLSLVSNTDDEQKSGLKLQYHPPSYNCGWLYTNASLTVEYRGLLNDKPGVMTLVSKDHQLMLFRNGMLIASTGEVKPSKKPLSFGSIEAKKTQPYSIKHIKVYSKAIFPSKFQDNDDRMVSYSGDQYFMKRVKIKDSSLPRVLIIGDSISGGYRKSVTNILKGKANVDHWLIGYKSMAGENSPMERALKGVLSEGPYDAVTFNFGLHYWPHEHRSPEDKQVFNMKKITDLMKRVSPKTSFFWLRTTPWRTTPDSGRPTLETKQNVRIMKFNKMTDNAMKEQGVSVVDLYRIAEKSMDTIKEGSKDSVHWGSGVSQLFAEEIVKNIKTAFPKKSSMTPQGKVSETEGLVAFWDFQYQEKGVWASRYDANVVSQSFDARLKRIGDPKSYALEDWPYADDKSKLTFDSTGPFGHAPLFNQGYVYAAVERNEFNKTPLDLHGRKPFTMIAWVKFVGRRHLVAGIWDEGGWDRYAGRRQVALFGGLFGKKGVISHVSETGAASYPQSKANGSQYARVRAIDGQDFKDREWVAMATSYDPDRNEVVAYLNGKMTKLKKTDSIVQNVHNYSEKLSANPFTFTPSIYQPRAFTVKYNGYDLKEVSEHRLKVNFDDKTLRYEQDRHSSSNSGEFRLQLNILRDGNKLLPKNLMMAAVHGQEATLPKELEVKPNDILWTSLEENSGNGWKKVGTEVKMTIREGAPFTFGRALGLGSEDLHHGSTLHLDGVAVFNRVLSEDELIDLSFMK